MANDTMTIDQLARYLRRDAREVTKLVNRGQVPGRKVGGEWRFSQAEINHWLTTQLANLSEGELQALEQPEPSRHSASASLDEAVLLDRLLHPDCVAVPLAARTRASVLRELVALAEQSWLVYNPEQILAAVIAREDQMTTAQPGGVAVPHISRPIPGTLGDSLIAFGRTASGIPFGAADRGLTDLFFLVLCDDSRLHLQVLARLARLFLRPGFLDSLRQAETAADARAVIVQAERDLLAQQKAGK
jgi:PTS system nitrogen regulatory IIA component